jgi:hypothetical protein
VQGHLLLHDHRLYLAGGNAVSPGIYNTKDGRCLNASEPLARCESTSPRGWELFLVGDRVIACGRPYYAHPDIPVYDHTVTKKLLHTRSGNYDIVWIDNRQLLCFDPLDTEVLSRCVTDERIPRHVTQAWGEFKVQNPARWHHETVGTALAVTRNAVVVAGPSTVEARDLKSGRSLWSQALPATPVPWGMAVNRHGNVILALTNGDVLAMGQ